MGEGVYILGGPRVQRTRLRILRRLSTLCPPLHAQGAPSPLPPGAREQRPNLRVRVWGGGRERRRGRLLQARHKETSFSLGSMATLGRGSAHPILPSPPAGMQGPRGPLTCRPTPGPGLPGLGPRGRRGRGPGRRLGLDQPGPGGSGRHNHGPGFEGCRQGLSRPGPGDLRGGVPEASCW